jgi:hypothetical protein
MASLGPTLDKFGVPVATGQSGRGLLMPKLKYRFRVVTQNFGTINPSAQTDLTSQVVSAGRPSIQHNRNSLHSYNNVVYIPQKPEWQTLEVVLRDDVTNSVSRLVAAQLQKQMNHYDQTSFEAGINYKFQMQISTLDGSIANEPLENWYIEGCFLETVSYDQFDYSSSDPMQITLTMSFDNATQDSNIMPRRPLPSARGFNA